MSIRIRQNGKDLLSIEPVDGTVVDLTITTEINTVVTHKVAVPDIPDPTPTPTPEPDAGFLWVSPQTLSNLPRSGTAWERVLKESVKDIGSPNASDKDSETGAERSCYFARGLVAAATQHGSDLERSRKETMGIIGTEGKEIHQLGPMRTMLAAVVVADLVGLSSSDDAKFSAWLQHMRTRRMGPPDGDYRTLNETTEVKANNFGGHALPARIAAARYLGDVYDLEEAHQLFRAWCGEWINPDFEPNGDAFNWTTASKDKFVPINIKGMKKDGHDIGGCISDDMRRSGDGKFKMPNPYDDKSDYPNTCLQGLVVAAELLHNDGSPAWLYGAKAIRRAFEFLYQPAVNWVPKSDDSDGWMHQLVNKRTGSNFPVHPDLDGGKVLGFAAWTHQ